MRCPVGGAFLVAAVVAGALGLPRSAVPVAAQQADHPGKPVYDRWCAGCHGVEGDGEGPSAGYMTPRPRDFTTALYQIRSTASGELPTDADLLHVVDVGMPGTAMPGWEGALTRQERTAVVEYIKTFSPFFERFGTPEPIDFGQAPGSGDDVLATGREVYERIECFKCHGDAGRGDGSSAPTLENEKDEPIPAADLTENWLFNGGGSVEDIYRRLRTGLNGTPMPSQADLIDAGVITGDELWALAHYVRSLSPERAPRPREVILVARVEEGAELPASVADSAWNEVEAFYVPLSGQIIVRPRWFAPRVDGVWVQGLHDDESLALRVSWSDPSRSPDPSWAPWRQRIESFMEPAEADTAGAATAGPPADRLVVEFPRRIPEGMERPYFLMGDQAEPVYVWGWESGEAGMSEGLARGIGRIEAQPGSSQSLTGDAAWEAGQWRVMLRRALATPDSTNDLQFATGKAIPVGFFAWDGDNAETGARAAVSTWYFLHLQTDTPVTVYLAPALAALLTAGLGVVVVARAQRREGEHTTEHTTEHPNEEST